MKTYTLDVTAMKIIHVTNSDCALLREWPLFGGVAALEI